MLTLHISWNLSGCLCTEFERRWTLLPGDVSLVEKTQKPFTAFAQYQCTKKRVKNFIDAKPRTSMLGHYQ